MHTHPTPSISALDVLLHVLLIKFFELLIKLRVFLSNFISVSINFLELFWEVRKALEKFFNHNYTKHESLSVSSKGFNHKF
jgi:hypothetical protein